MTERDGVVILDPTIRSGSAIVPAPRLPTLDGRTIGLLDNSKEKAAVFLAALAEGLSERFKIKAVTRRKPTYSRVAPPSLIADLREHCEAVVTAMGA